MWGSPPAGGVHGVLQRREFDLPSEDSSFSSFANIMALPHSLHSPPLTAQLAA